MKTRNKIATVQMAVVLCIVAAFISCSDGGGGNSSPQEQPQKKPDTQRTFTLGTTACKVTIKSDDLFLTAEWTALCNKVVGAIERGYGASGDGGKIGNENYFTGHTVTVVLLKSTTYDAEVKSTVPGTIYFKANGSSIDGIPNDKLSTLLLALNSTDSVSWHYPE